MKTKISALSTLLLALSVSVLTEAQQPAKVPRIGMIVTGSASTHKSRIDAFRQGLSEFGYVEGKNIVIEYRYGEGKRDRFPEIAAEMVRLRPDVIVVGSTGLTAAVKQATTTIPIVASADDLVGAGLVISLAWPGGNVTGLTGIAPDLSGKRLELLKEVVTNASRVAVLWYPSAADEDEVKQTEIAARALGVKIQSVGVHDPNEFQGAFATMKRENAKALIIIQGSFTLFHRRQLAELATKIRLPLMCQTSLWTDDGCLMSYGADPVYQYRRKAFYVDKILKGVKPAELPVEQPRKFELVINLKAAKQIGLTIPQSVLFRADKVIR